MKIHAARLQSLLICLVVSLLIGMQLACSRSVLPEDSASWRVPGEAVPQPIAGGAALTTQTPVLPAARAPGAPILTPTPDNPHPLPTLRTEPLQYVVQPGDTLGTIAQRYGVSLEEMVRANSLINPNLLDIGQMLTVPVPTPFGIGPDFKVIPDSELVYGPASTRRSISTSLSRARAATCPGIGRTLMRNPRPERRSSSASPKITRSIHGCCWRSWSIRAAGSHNRIRTSRP